METKEYESLASYVPDEGNVWVPWDEASGSDIKLCKLNPSTGEMIVFIRTPPNKTLTKHFHPGTVVVYVVQGQWTYNEGWVDPLVVALLNRLASSQLSEHFRVVGTHALCAYETAAGVRLEADALATRDIDLLWDTRKRITFFAQLARVDSSMLGVLKKADPTFRMRQSQKYTAVNKDGFEVDIIRREQTGDDPHPIKLSDADEDFWVAQARPSNVLLDSPSFSAVIVATNGTMARMNTVHPATFVAFKRWMAAQTDRDALKRRRDALQADAVDQLLERYFPQI